MTLTSAPDIHQLILDHARSVIAAIADRPKESPDQRTARAQEAIRQIEAYEPRTPLEIMLAAQAVLFQNLALDAVHEANRANVPDEARRSRQQAMVLGRVQMSYIKELNRGRAAAARQAKEAGRSNTAVPPAREAAEIPQSAPAAPPPAEDAATPAPPVSQATPPVPARDNARKTDADSVTSRLAINAVLQSTPARVQVAR